MMVECPTHDMECTSRFRQKICLFPPHNVGSSSARKHAVSVPRQGTYLIGMWCSIDSSPEMMRHPDLKIDTSDLGPLLSPAVVTQLQTSKFWPKLKSVEFPHNRKCPVGLADNLVFCRYLQLMRSNFQEWMANSLKTDKKVGVYSTGFVLSTASFERLSISCCWQKTFCIQLTMLLLTVTPHVYQSQSSRCAIKAEKRFILPVCRTGMKRANRRQMTKVTSTPLCLYSSSRW